MLSSILQSWSSSLQPLLQAPRAHFRLQTSQALTLQQFKVVIIDCDKFTDKNLQMLSNFIGWASFLYCVIKFVITMIISWVYKTILVLQPGSNSYPKKTSIGNCSVQHDHLTITLNSRWNKIFDLIRKCFSLHQIYFIPIQYFIITLCCAHNELPKNWNLGAIKFHKELINSSQISLKSRKAEPQYLFLVQIEIELDNPT